MDAALELVGERWRAELGLLRKVRLCFDLAIDLCVSVPKLYWDAQDNARRKDWTHASPTFVILYGHRVGARTLLVAAILSIPLFLLPSSARFVKPVLFAWTVCRLAGRTIQFVNPIGKEPV